MVVAAGLSARTVLIRTLVLFAGIAMLDQVATRPVEIEVEAYRTEGLSDQEVMMEALEEGLAEAQDTWWVRGRRTRLVFDEARRYDIASPVFDLLEMEQVSSEAGIRSAEIHLP